MRAVRVWDLRRDCPEWELYADSEGREVLLRIGLRVFQLWDGAVYVGDGLAVRWQRDGGWAWRRE